jgi:hypothetical protein
MDSLDADAVKHLCKLLGLLGSQHDGERAAAGLKAHEFLKRYGLTWCDVITVPTAIAQQPQDQLPNWRVMVEACLNAQAWLNHKERAFLHTLTNWRGTPSEKQIAWLTRIYENLP